MVIGFNDSPEKPLRLAIELHKNIIKYNGLRKGKQKLSIRIGMDTGPVYFIKDVTGKENFWGPGIIMARRVMDLARPMQILASSRIANDIRKLSTEYKLLLHNIGDYKIKHGEKISIFNIYGSGLGNKLSPGGKLEGIKDDQVKGIKQAGERGEQIPAKMRGGQYGASGHQQTAAERSQGKPKRLDPRRPLTRHP